MNNHEEELKFQKAEFDRRLLKLEILIAIITILSFSIIFIMCVYAMSELNLYLFPIIIMIVASVLLIFGATICVIIEQKAGYYECGRCHYKYVPTLNQTMWTPHILRTRYMKCPHCNKCSWNKKVIK